MLFRKRNIKEKLSDNQPQEGVKEELSECNPKPIRKVIDGKLYDTSNATHICNLCVWYEKIPDYKYGIYYLGGESVSIYKGNTEWFIEVHGDIKPVNENWVKGILGEYNIEKYIELFGNPELA